MGRFTKIPQSTFDDLQTDAGVLLKQFDPSNPSAPADADIITATTGGITVTCAPEYSDYGEDVDNVPNNMKELKHLDSWNCSLSTTAIGTSAELIKLSLGAADIDGTTKIVPRAGLDQNDFADLWWVGDKADGGLVAVKLMNALSTAGFSLKTTKNGKGQLTLELTGHVSIDDQDTVPMEFYSMSGEDSTVTYVYEAVSNPGTANPKQQGWYVLIGDNYRLTSDTVVDDNVTYYERTSST